MSYPPCRLVLDPVAFHNPRMAADLISHDNVIVIRRRDLLGLFGGAMCMLRRNAARAQQKAMPVIGFLGDAATPSTPLDTAFRQGLSETDYIVGKNVAVEYRGAEGHKDRLPALAAELVSRNVDVIVAIPFSPAVAAKQATQTIPIVFISGVDPVAAGLVASLAHPGGNLTGVNFFTAELVPKRIELLSDLVPRVKVIALLVNPNNSNMERLIGYAHEAARAKGLKVQILKASTETEIDDAFAALQQSRAEGLVLGADSFFYRSAEQLAAQALRNAVPATGESREFAASGGLISYGTKYTEVLRKVGVYAGRILKGERPADLPVQQPDKFELVINLNTAKALGLTVPQSLLARADEVIE